MKIINVVGARPNFVKIASLIVEMKKYAEIEALLVHTGQHYDRSMSRLFFDDLDIPEPDVNLGVGSSSHAKQTAEVMQRFETVLIDEKPDLVLVVGDVNSTIACSLTAVKLGISVAHVEAGLRSFDRSMPEEVNRVLTDAISDFLFTTERSANENLLKEGISSDKIFFVGNTMIDTLIRNKEKARKSRILQELGLLRNGSGHESILRGEGLELTPKNTVLPYAVLTLHRPSNVDEADTLLNIFRALKEISKNIPILFPTHPRTKKQIESFGLSNGWFKWMDEISSVPEGRGVYLFEPLGYLDFLQLMGHAKLVLTDSGGIQEEATVLGIPCVTLRENTERPITLAEGTNVLVGMNRERIIEESLKAIGGATRKSKIPELWDGKASYRIVKILLERFSAGG